MPQRRLRRCNHVIAILFRWLPPNFSPQNLGVQVSAVEARHQEEIYDKSSFYPPTRLSLSTNVEEKNFHNSSSRVFEVNLLLALHASLSINCRLYRVSRPAASPRETKSYGKQSLARIILACLIRHPREQFHYIWDDKALGKKAGECKLILSNNPTKLEQRIEGDKAKQTKRAMRQGQGESFHVSANGVSRDLND